MKQMIIVTTLLTLFLTTTSCAPKAKPAGVGVGREAEIAGRWSTYEAMLSELIPGMGAANAVNRTQPQDQFEEVCFHAARPGAEEERRELCRAIVKRIGPETPAPARVWMLRQLAHIGGDESVGRLAQLLSDPDPRIREVSRRALQNISSMAAAGALCWALEYAEDDAWRVALVNAIAVHPDAFAYIELMGRDGGHSTFRTVCEMAKQESPAVAAAAIAALGDFGTDAAVEELLGLRTERRRELDLAAISALLRCAERRLDAGRTDEAFALYRHLYEADPTTSERIAALHGMVCARGQEMVPLLLATINGGDTQMAAIAASFVEEIPGSETTSLLIEAFEQAAPTAQALLLRTLAGRGDRKAYSTAVAGLESDDAQVRIAALRALQVLGSRSAVVLLAESSARSSGDEREVARQSLSRLRGDGVDEAILTALQEEGDVAARCELIRALATRWYRPALPTLFDVTHDEDESVQVAAFEALGTLAREEELPQLAQRLTDTLGAEAREAAEDAAVGTALRIEDEQQRAAPVLARLDGTSGPVKASMIRVLGRIGGARALEAIRAARHSEDADVVDAAVRALANWPDVEVMDDLLDVARTSPDETHGILALRGYVRLVRLPSERESLDTFRLLEEALALTTRAEEKRLVLSGLADVAHPAALKLAESHLGDPDLRDEAAVTTLAIARALAASQREAALEAIENVRMAGVGEAAQDKLDELVTFIERYSGYGAAWLVEGPYMQEGRKSEDLFELVFPPETPGALDVDWSPLAVNNRDNPWIFDLKKAVGGDSRCVYVKTLVWSAGQQPAVLELGSDDAVKAWLNGELVHSNLVYRGVAPAQDKVTVTLDEGWNTLMLKIVQGNGEWGFCAGFGSADGGPMKGLSFKAE